VAIRYLGAAYLVFLAWRLWTAFPAPAESAPAKASGDGIRLFLGGLALALGNPKTMLFYLALLPGLVALDALTTLGFAELAITITIVYAIILALYIRLAAPMRRVFTTPRAMRIVNRTAGTAMFGAAIAVAARR
jgi:threonine/homoserine/homoserine lactone efflux protein